MWEKITEYFVSLVDFNIYIITVLPLKLLESVPVPSFLNSTTFFIPDGVMWFISSFEVTPGLAIMSVAWGTRFMIRRMPIVG